jgi:hypothetical protein
MKEKMDNKSKHQKKEPEVNHFVRIWFLIACFTLWYIHFIGFLFHVVERESSVIREDHTRIER